VNGSAAVAVEAEVRLTDIQALDRRIALKRRDGDIDVVILLIGDTKVNRAVIAAHRSALRPAFPLDARGVLGLSPPASSRPPVAWSYCEKFRARGARTSERTAAQVQFQSSGARNLA